ncbi:CRISPR-associated endonuclease Cas2 [bacterium]|nr:CRISPR-associated endonuclease Cas2 [bacterium]
MKMWYLIAYDIRDAKRLRKVAGKLESYGERVQYSLFRCRLDRPQLEKLRWELSEIVASVDSLLVMPVCAQCAAKVPIHSTEDQTGWAEDQPSFRIV